ncbi:MAG: hypothetical protein ACI8TX_002487 [Hyphomicrobiaceae bacterium]|jgi:uncharacterized protein (DUF983 family)
MQCLWSGFRTRCPRCAQGRLFEGWLSLRTHCDHCALLFQEGSGDTWAVLYLSTAGVTGLIVVSMLLLGADFIARHRIGLAVVATILIVASLPYRKGLAVALEYLVNRSLDEVDRAPANGSAPSSDKHLDKKKSDAELQ